MGQRFAASRVEDRGANDDEAFFVSREGTAARRTTESITIDDERDPRLFTRHQVAPPPAQRDFRPVQRE